MPTLGKTKVSPSLISTGSLFLGTSSYAVTASFALNASGGGGGGGSVQTGSIANQTLWTNVTSGSTNTISGLSLSSNKWNVNVVEEWDAATLDQYYNSCSLLCHFDSLNAAGRFIDNSRNNFAITSSGNVGLSTSQYKFGGASAFFDGTGDYLSTNSSNNFAFGTGNFTVEFWIYSSDVSSAQRGFLQTSDTAGGLKTSYTTGIIIIQGINGSASPLNGGLGANVVGTWVGSSTAVISTNTWYHIALVRNSGTSTLYVNGTSVGSGTTTGNCSGTYLAIGGYYDTSYLYQGYIDELRITKGVARYTANFTPPNAPFPNSRNQVLTKYVGLVGGIDDKYVDYGVQKLSDSSLKLTRLTYPNQPIVGSGSLSGSVSRVYVNVLDYTKVSVTSSYATNALNSVNSLDIPKIKSIIYTNSGYTPTTASAVDLVKGNNYIIISGSNFKSSASVFIDATTGSIVSYVNTNRLNVNVATKTAGTYPIYLMNTDGASTFKINAITYIAGTTNTTKAIFGYGTDGVSMFSMTNLVSNTGVVATDTTGVGTARAVPSAAGYGTDKAIFGYGISTGPNLSMTNLVSNTGVVATDTTGVGTARRDSAAAGYGTDKAIFGYGTTIYDNPSAVVSVTNLVSNTGVVATDTTGVGTARSGLSSARYGNDKAIFGYGKTSGNVSMTNLVSNIGVVATDTTGVGTARNWLAASGYGNDKAIFGYGITSGAVSMTNLVSNTGIVTTDTTGVGTNRYILAAAGYGTDKAVFGYGYTSANASVTNLVSNTGIVATDTTGVGTARHGPAAAGYSIT
jgi:hypothetical protein